MMRYKEITEDSPPSQKTVQSETGDLVSKNEQKIITRAKAPLKGKGKRFESLADQDAYVRKILST